MASSTRSSVSGHSKPHSKSGQPRVSDVFKKMSTEEKIDSILNMVTEFKDNMRTEMEKLRENIKEENLELFERMEGRVFELERSNDFLKHKVMVLDKELERAFERIDELETKRNDLEQQGRKNSIRVLGLTDDNKKESVEDTVEKVVELVKSFGNVNICDSDIDTAHRLGVYQQGRPRPIICKFVQRRKKTEIIKERKKLKNTGVTIVEDLTKTNQQRLKDAYSLPCVERTWSSDGKLFVLLKK